MIEILPGLAVSRETYEKLVRYTDLIAKWTRKINLVSAGSREELWNRHILDCAQVFQHSGDDWNSWTDLGSGAGLPGAVVSILDMQKRRVTLVEADKRKAAFLNTVRRELGLNLVVVNTRIEHSDIKKADILSARALAPLSMLLDYSMTLLGNDGMAIFQKGATFQEEIVRARKMWNFQVESFESHTNPEAAILKISGIERSGSFKDK